MNREAERQSKANERQRRVDERTDAAERARYEVELHEELIEFVASVHRECGPEWDWYAVRDTPPLAVPSPGDDHEQKARHALELYTPTFWDWFLARGGDKRAELRTAIKRARSRDRDDYVEDVKSYKSRLATWTDTCELATRIISGDIEAYSIAIQESRAFSDLPIAKTSLTIAIPKPKTIQIDFDADADSVVPVVLKKVLASGVLSIRDMSKKDHQSLYINYTCVCVLRVAREVFALLPIDQAIVTAHRRRPNLRSGHIEQQPVVSAAIPRGTLRQIRWDLVHPTRCMTNFLHRMQFDESTVAIPILPVNSAEI